MKPLKPSHREKRRYLLLKGKDVSQKNINEAILNYVGTLGYSKISPMFVKTLKDSIILSVNRLETDKTIASFLVSGKEISVNKVSGAINKLK